MKKKKQQRKKYVVLQDNVGIFFGRYHKDKRYQADRDVDVFNVSVIAPDEHLNEEAKQRLLRARIKSAIEHHPSATQTYAFKVELEQDILGLRSYKVTTLKHSQEALKSELNYTLRENSSVVQSRYNHAQRESSSAAA